MDFGILGGILEPILPGRMTVHILMRNSLKTWILVLPEQASGGPVLLRALCQTTGLGWNSAATGLPVIMEMPFLGWKSAMEEPHMAVGHWKCD